MKPFTSRTLKINRIDKRKDPAPLQPPDSLSSLFSLLSLPSCSRSRSSTLSPSSSYSSNPLSCGSSSPLRILSRRFLGFLFKIFELRDSINPLGWNSRSGYILGFWSVSSKNWHSEHGDKIWSG
ncbi:hypothetical protein K1719_040105 [Acacia pycnantha]|nr:hypothetical protein K1719_040105 [Acacia pycnantha]